MHKMSPQYSEFRIKMQLMALILTMVLSLVGFRPASALPAGGSLSFNGTSSYVTFGNVNGIGVTNFTLEAMVFWTGGGVTTSTGAGGITAIPIVSKGRAEADGSNLDMNYFLGITAAGNLAADFEDTATGLNHPVTATSTMLTNTWNHVAATYNSTTGTWFLYVNGVQVGTANAGAGILPRSDSIQHASIGTAMTSTGLAAGFFAGRIDEVRIWNTDRAPAQIQASMFTEVSSGANLVARWGMSEGAGAAINSSVGTFPGVMTNAPTWHSGFPFGSAVRFDGTNDYVTFGNTTALGAVNFTLETWFYWTGGGVTTTTGTGGATTIIPLVTKGRGEGDNSNLDMNYVLGIQNNRLAADFEEGAGQASPGLNHPVYGNTVITTNAWHHAAATYDSANAVWILYLDGVQDATLDLGSNIAPRSDSIQHAGLGTAMTSTGVTAGFFQGIMDEARIWNVVRTPAEIQTNRYSELTSGTGLLARWGLDEGIGVAATDSVAPVQNGTLTNGPTWVPGFPFPAPVDVTAPAAPTALTAIPYSGGVLLSWTANTELDLAGYNIYRSTSPSVPLVSPINGGTLYTGTTYNDAGLVNGTTYYYVITAVDASANPSAASNEVNATPLLSLGAAVQFNGSNQYATFGVGNSLAAPVYTIETWFKRTGTGVGVTTGTGGIASAIPLITKGTSEAEAANADINYFLGIDAGTGTLIADFEEGAGGAAPSQNHPVSGTTVIANNTWYHAAVTYDGTTLNLYLNGTLEGSVVVGQPTASATTSPTAFATSIRSNGTTLQGFFQGVMDEARVWNRALPLNELQSNINSQLTSGTGLIARWGMDEGTGATISSSVGTFNGALTNGPLWVPGAPFNLTFNAPPSAPTLVSPSDGAIDTSTSPTLSVDVTDPDGGSLTVQFYGRPVTAAAGADFSIIAIPDTQYYTSSLNGGLPAIMDTQTQWAVDNMAAYNIQFVTQLGDCTEHGDQFIVEWQNADQFFQTIENPLTTGLTYGLPYGIAPGNHDQTPIGTPAGTTLYNQFFGEARFLGRDYYGGHYGTDNDNHYELFSASGMDFIVIHLEYDTSANAAVLAWADNLLQTYSTRRAIVVTHWLINGGNNATYSTQGQAIYNALKDNPNLFLMLGGHVPSPAEGQRSDTFNGNTVYSLMSDYQGRANGGNGWLRIITISPTNNNIQVKTYSPWLNQFETDADSQFSLPANLVNSFQLIGTDTVPSGGTASVTWPSLNNSTEYEWYAVVSDGSASATSSTWSFTTEAPANVPPTITGQNPLATNEDTSLTIVPANLTVTDPDNTYPTGFSLTVQSGANYTLAGNTITPALNFNGTLTVPVKVNDGLADSNIFNLTVTVTPVNDAPVITNPGNQNNSEGSTISLQIVANDVDNASLTYSATNLPTGLAINPTNGSINGAVDYSAAASSPFNVTVTASDGVGGVTSINFTWTITDAIPPASGLVCTDLASKPATASTGEKPQSKVWQHDGVWWAVFPTNTTGASSAGTWLWRLQGTTWVEELKLSTAINTKADVKTIGDEAHILLYAGTTTQLISAEYNGASYVTWSGRAAPSNISLPNSEIATIEIDSMGRMWLASENDATGQIVAYYSDSPYSIWSGPVTIATGVNNDDIATIIALPSNQIGILWSNQNTQRFGFRIHNDGGAPATWAADEVPASQSAQNVGLGMADDHMHMSVASDGTIYAVVKTSYDTAGYPKIALLVRRPAGTWDNLYNIDESGTRATLMLDEVNGYLTVLYTSAEGYNPMVYKQSTISPIAFGNRSTLNTGAFNDASASKGNYTSELVTIFSSAIQVAGEICAPIPLTGADLSITKTDTVTSVRPTDTITYSIVVHNNGPQAVTGASVQDTLPAAFSTASWTCTGAGGGICAANGTGSINQLVILPVGANATFILTAQVSNTATVSFTNTATVSNPVGMTDPLLANNSASDTDSIIATTAACENDSTLVGCWPMEEGSGTSLIDGSAYFNDGAISNGAAWVAGQVGTYALDLNGTSQYALVPHDASLNLTNTITVAAWIRPEQYATQDIIKKATNGGVNGFELSLATTKADSSSRKVFFRINQVANGDTYRINSTTEYPIDGTWMHVAATYDGATMRLYINGVEEASLATTVPIATNTLPVGIGAQSDGTRWFMGWLDEARVYNRVLTLDEIQTLFGNHPPVAVTDPYTTNEDTAINATALTGVLSNDNDPDLDTLTAVKDSDPINGVLVFNANGSFTYTPTVNFCGSDSFTYHANDGQFNSAVTTVDLTITCVNDVPTTTGIANVTVAEDAANTTIDLWPSFADVENTDAQLTYTVTGNTNAALFTSVSMTGGQNLVLDYAPDQFGSAQLTVRATDAGAPSQFIETTFTVTVTPINDAPTTSGIANATVNEDAVNTSIDLWTSFADVEDADSALAYSVTGNTNPALFTSATVVVGQNLVLDYAPNANGSANITIRATDLGALFVETTFMVTVNPVSDPPTFTSTPVTTAIEDSPYTYNIVTNDPDTGDTLTITAPTLPTWLSIVDNGNGTATLSGTPLNGNVGINNITLRVNDGTTDADQIFTITVTNTNDVPFFTSAPITTAAQDTLYTYNITASDPDLGAVLNITAPTLPAWLTFTDNGNGTATLSGTPTNANVGIHNITLQVSDGIANVNQIFAIDVGNTNDAPSFTSAAIIIASEDTAYTYAITTSDPDLGSILTITAPTLPIWLTLTDNGDGTAALSGTPLNANVGNNTVVLQVSDGIASVQQSFTIVVSNVNDAPFFTSTAVTIATEDAVYSYSITASDPDLGAVLTLTAPTLPTWLTLTNTGNGIATLSGIPTNANVGIHNVTLNVSDGIANVDQTFTITVTNVNDAPVFTSIAVTASTESAAYAYAIIANDPDLGDTLNITAPTLPAWLSLVDNGNGTATLTGTPTNAEVGNHNVTLRVGDGTASADQVFVVVVANINDAPIFTSVAVTAATEDVLYTYNIVTADADLGDTLTITAPTLPAWLSLMDHGDGTATLSGTPLNDNVGIHNVTLRVNDGTVNIDQSFTITVANANDSPTDIALSNNIVDESLPVGTIAGTFSTTDPDLGDTFTYSFCGGADDSSFQIAGNILQTAAVLDADIQNTFNICIHSQDAGGLFLEEQFVISITNVNDAPIITLQSIAKNIDESSPLFFNTTNASLITVSDPDAGTDAVQVILSVTQGSLTLSTNSGLTFITGDGTADITMTFSGSLADINTALNSMHYDPPTGFNGSDTLQIDIDDLGNNGLGGNQTDSASINLTMLALPPKVAPNGINTASDTGDGILAEGEVVTTSITQFIVTFDQDLNNPIGNTAFDDVTNPVNFMLVHDNSNDFQTTSCASGVNTQDIAIIINSVTYNNNGGSGPFVATLNVNNGLPLAYGNYRLFICGTTSITDLYGLKLAGDGTQAGTDMTRTFTIPNGIGGGGGGGGTTGNAGANTFKLPLGGLIPVTGFAPGQSTPLPIQTESLLYDSKENLRLEIPSLSINQPIVGIKYNNGWDVTWLESSIGYLEGSAYPTWAGNTVLTGHATDASGNVTSFAYIKDLKIGETFKIHANGLVFIYQVQENRLLAPTGLSALFKHEEYDWVTLVTCENWNKDLMKFTQRRIVRASLISVILEK